MTREQFVIGLRVKTIRDVDMFPVGVFPAGSTGTVVSADPTEGVESGYGPIAHVRLDQHFPALNEWNNELQVFGDAACTMEDFAPL